MYHLEDLRILIDARDDDSVSSWTSAKSYGDVLEETRRQCPKDRHIVTLAEYMHLWMRTVGEIGSRACNEADIWLTIQKDVNEHLPISYVRHPFKSTALVDTYLAEFRIDSKGNYEALLVVGGEAQKRLVVPPTGKIYHLNEFGLPTRTGGRKVKDSEPFEHRWWAFSSDRVRTPEGSTKRDFKMALFCNGGTIGCFCELIKAHYSLDDSGGFYRVLTLPNEMRHTTQKPYQTERE